MAKRFYKILKKYNYNEGWNTMPLQDFFVRLNKLDPSSKKEDSKSFVPSFFRTTDEKITELENECIAQFRSILTYLDLYLEEDDEVNGVRAVLPETVSPMTTYANLCAFSHIYLQFIEQVSKLTTSDADVLQGIISAEKIRAEYFTVWVYKASEMRAQTLDRLDYLKEIVKTHQLYLQEEAEKDCNKDKDSIAKLSVKLGHIADLQFKLEDKSMVPEQRLAVARTKVIMSQSEIKQSHNWRNTFSSKDDDFLQKVLKELASAENLALPDHLFAETMGKSFKHTVG